MSKLHIQLIVVLVFSCIALPAIANKQSFQQEINTSIKDILLKYSLDTSVLKKNTKVFVKVWVSKTGKKNFTFFAKVLHDVKLEDSTVIIAAGTPVDCSYIYDYARGAGVPGKLSIKYISTNTIDGKFVELAGLHSQMGKSRELLAGQLAGVFVFIPPFFPFNFFFLLIKGKETIFGGEEIIQTTFIKNDIRLFIKK